MKPATFEISMNTRLIRQRLAASKIGDVVSYVEMSTLISAPVSGSTASLQSAVNSLLHQERMRFGCIRGEGLKRLSDREIVAAANSDVDRIRRGARRGTIKITAVQDFAAMTPQDQLAHTTQLSILTATRAMTSHKAIKRIEAVATGRSTELPIAETLRAFLVGNAAKGAGRAS